MTLVSAESLIVDEALKAAKDAETAFRNLHGEPMYCGFAWVKVRPGNSRMAKYLKSIKLGDTSYSGGVDVWNPGGSNTQSMDIKEEGARAFAAVLTKYGIRATSMSRPD